MSQAQDRFVLTVPADPEWVCVARLLIAGFANQRQLDLGEIEDLRLVMGELFNQLLSFRYQSSKCFRVEVSCKEKVVCIKMTVEESKTLSDENAELSFLGFEKDRSLGLFLLRHLVEKLEFFWDEKTTCLTVWKRIG